MKLIPIFVPENSEDGEWSILEEKENQNEFDKFFDLINDIERLHNFFENNKADLAIGYFGGIS